jgi:hypothetical protein
LRVCTWVGGFGRFAAKPQAFLKRLQLLGSPSFGCQPSRLLLERMANLHRFLQFGALQPPLDNGTEAAGRAYISAVARPRRQKSGVNQRPDGFPYRIPADAELLHQLRLGWNSRSDGPLTFFYESFHLRNDLLDKRRPRSLF